MGHMIGVLVFPDFQLLDAAGEAAGDVTCHCRA